MNIRTWVLILLVGATLTNGCTDRPEQPPLHGAAIGGSFELIDQNGHRVRDTDFAGQYRLIYFGYSYCPDVCPNDLQVIGQGLSRFEKAAPAQAKRVQPIFITVDPQRDTPAVLKDYVSAFHPRLLGLTGTSEQIDAVKKRFAIFSAKQPPPGDGGYLVDHTRQAVLFGPRGDPITLVPQDQGPDAVAKSLDKWVL